MRRRKVFISYSHDSDFHRKRVLELADRLRNDGIDCEIDQYIIAPKEGWPRWMMQHIQRADYVLMACTEIYRKRIELEEEQGRGLGAKWEGSLIFNILYRDETINRKFIPILFESTDKSHIPNILFGYDHYDLSAPCGYQNLYRHIRGEMQSVKPLLGKVRYVRTIYSDSLPTVEGDLFGRTKELALLDAAWTDHQVNMIQFIAPGGTGKTKLLRFWLDQTDSVESLIAWSFYSQGSSEDRQVSATPFFTHAFEVLNSNKNTFSTEEEKGEHLANLLRQRRCLLVLDGLEPLQYAGRGMRGEVKDRAIRQLLKNIAGEHNCLCIITTRIAVHELCNRPRVIQHNLQNLTPDDGANLLKSFGVRGSQIELESASKEYACNALALHLLGNALVTYLDGDVRRRDTLAELIDDYDDDSRHAFKVMQAYSKWLTGSSELKVLYLLGLFDHPIEVEVLQMLWKAEIPNLTAEICEKEWKVAIRDLQKRHRILSVHENDANLLDCHPLIREYFGKQLLRMYPECAALAHRKLYIYYKSLQEKELPDTLEEMRPLFFAIAHSCAANMQQDAWENVYKPRILRWDDNYIAHKLGGITDDLSVLSHFLVALWDTPSENLKSEWRAEVLNRVGFHLRALGRLQEAVEPMEATCAHDIREARWRFAAIASSNLSELHLVLGNISKATSIARRGVIFADMSDDWVEQRDERTTLADALHHAGAIEEAGLLFDEAERIQKLNDQDNPFLYSLRGYRYCDYLLTKNDQKSALKRTLRAIEMSKTQRFPLLICSLDKLMLGRIYLKYGSMDDAKYYIDQALDLLRKSCQMQYLPSGLLIMAEYYREAGSHQRAVASLNEAHEIASNCGMKLYLADYYIEHARLSLGRGRLDETRQSTETARDIILATGYKKRLTDLTRLQEEVSSKES
jgi:tetratricopeptide (TPR) repeat protein